MNSITDNRRYSIGSHNLNIQIFNETDVSGLRAKKIFADNNLAMRELIDHLNERIESRKNNNKKYTCTIL
jgi:hypothetical protein